MALAIALIIILIWTIMEIIWFRQKEKLQVDLNWRYYYHNAYIYFSIGLIIILLSSFGTGYPSIFGILMGVPLFGMGVVYITIGYYLKEKWMVKNNI
jgi:hypothetical protein